LGEVLARADGLGATGAGHVTRQLALAQAWSDFGGQASLATVGAAPAVLDRWRREGFTVLSPAGAAGRRPAWAVADGYDLGPDDIEPWRVAGAKVAQVDDHAAGAALGASLIVDQNLGARATAYRARRAETVLVGPRYCLLRREHRRPPPRQVERRVARVLLTLGGASPADELARLERLVRAAVPGAEVVTFGPGATVDGVADVLASVDLAVAAAGTTTWELLAWGVPALLVALAANQEPVADAVGAAGVALRLDAAGAEQQIASTAADADLRQALASGGQRLVDGDGARRVAVALRAAAAATRPVGTDDIELLWNWANDPSTRATAIHPEPISWVDHCAWFGAGRRSPDRFHRIVDVDGRPAGQVRFDGISSGGRAEISVSVDRDRRGLGFGPVIIRAGMAALRREQPDLPVVALIRPENQASLRSFDLAGFMVQGSESRHGVDLLRLRDGDRQRVGGPR